MKKEGIEIFHALGRSHWRQWLQENHASKQAIYLVSYKQHMPNALSWSEAVDEALCFGWIDSTRNKYDEDRFQQLFTRRKEKSTWSKINKEKIDRLIQEGLMTKAGLLVIEKAKINGSWNLLDSAEELVIPKDLEMAFRKNKTAKGYFLSLSRSVRKAILQWLILAKREDTRKKRIQELVSLAAKSQKPKQF